VKRCHTAGVTVGNKQRFPFKATTTTRKWLAYLENKLSFRPAKSPSVITAEGQSKASLRNPRAPKTASTATNQPKLSNVDNFSNACNAFNSRIKRQSRSCPCRHAHELFSNLERFLLGTDFFFDPCSNQGRPDASCALNVTRTFACPFPRNILTLSASSGRLWRG
jgi:hypothetical protein